ncbi:MAG: glycosyltransferase [Bacilli bacterium]|nr:glycosyltransferase [Bacilli bacterium]
MIRVLQVIDNMNAGGMENMLMNYYRKIVKYNIQFDFLIFHKNKCFFEDEIISLGGNIFKVTSRRDNFILNRVETEDFFKTYHYDYVEFHQGITYYFPLEMAKKYNYMHRIIHNHGINRNYLKNFKLYNEIWAKKRISNLANHYFTCSHEVNSHLFSKNVLLKEQIYLINNAIDINKFKFDLDYRSEIRKEFNIKKDEVLVGHIGTFTTPKNHKFLIEVFNIVSKMRNNYRLLCVGEGPLKDGILKKIDEMNLTKNVQIVSKRHDVNKILSAIDILVFPSLYEGIPLTIVEAQASGVSIVCSNNINKNTFITDNVEFLSLAENAEIWANKIVSLSYLKEQRNSKYEMMLKSNYDIDNEVLKLSKIYYSL